MSASSTRHGVLNLKAGEWVEVRDQEEILATLDQHGRLENQPFMPEMLQYCGKRIRVSKRADKTCQYVVGWSIRRVKDSVHLDGVRCDGTGHGGCEASCLIFWKEAWLKRAEPHLVSAAHLQRRGAASAQDGGPCTTQDILAASQTTNPGGEQIHSCQATEVFKFSSHMSLWDPRQYIRDLRSGNLRHDFSGDSRSARVLEFLLGILQVIRALVMSFFTEYRHLNYPATTGTLETTSIEVLDLQPGELVQVRSRAEILATLDKESRNRGLLFDGEMYPYCGGIYRVLRRVHHIVDDKTGKMVDMRNPCIVLDGVVCRSDYHRLCPRAIYPYWRENWLQRVFDERQVARASVSETQGVSSLPH